MIRNTTTTGVTRGRWRSWTMACALAEAIGIGLAAGAAILIGLAMDEPVTAPQKTLVLVLMVGAGALEGLALGLFQSSVLGEAFLKMSPRSSPSWCDSHPSRWKEESCSVANS